MRMFDIDGNSVSANVKESRFPMKSVSRSSLQGETGKALRVQFPFDIILEDFTIPGCKLSVDFFLPKRKIVVEVQGGQHDQFTPFFHGDKSTSTAYMDQNIRDTKKQNWAEMNGFDFVEIRTEEDIDAKFRGKSRFH